MEVDLINKLNTLSPNGYNLEKGGNLNKKMSLSTKMKISRTRIERKIGCREINQYDEDYNLIKSWGSIVSIERKLGIKSCGIRKVCNRENHHAGGYVWRYKDGIQFTDEDIRQKSIRDEWKLLVSNSTDRGVSHTRMVKCITTGMVFNTLTDGARYYNTDKSAISKVCRGKIYYSGEFNGEKLVWGYIN